MNGRIAQLVYEPLSAVNYDPLDDVDFDALQAQIAIPDVTKITDIEELVRIRDTAVSIPLDPASEEGKNIIEVAQAKVNGVLTALTDAIPAVRANIANLPVGERAAYEAEIAKMEAVGDEGAGTKDGIKTIVSKMAVSLESMANGVTEYNANRVEMVNARIAALREAEEDQLAAEEAARLAAEAQAIFGPVQAVSTTAATTIDTVQLRIDAAIPDIAVKRTAIGAMTDSAALTAMKQQVISTTQVDQAKSTVAGVLETLDAKIKDAQDLIGQTTGSVNASYTSQLNELASQLRGPPALKAREIDTLLTDIQNYNQALIAAIDERIAALGGVTAIIDAIKADTTIKNSAIVSREDVVKAVLAALPVDTAADQKAALTKTRLKEVDAALSAITSFNSYTPIQAAISKMQSYGLSSLATSLIVAKFQAMKYAVQINTTTKQIAAGWYTDAQGSRAVAVYNYQTNGLRSVSQLKYYNSDNKQTGVTTIYYNTKGEMRQQETKNYDNSGATPVISSTIKGTGVFDASGVKIRDDYEYKDSKSRLYQKLEKYVAPNGTQTGMVLKNYTFDPTSGNTTKEVMTTYETTGSTNKLVRQITNTYTYTGTTLMATVVKDCQLLFTGWNIVTRTYQNGTRLTRQVQQNFDTASKYLGAVVMDTIYTEGGVKLEEITRTYDATNKRVGDDQRRTYDEQGNVILEGLSYQEKIMIALGEPNATARTILDIGKSIATAVLAKINSYINAPTTDRSRQILTAYNPAVLTADGFARLATYLTTQLGTIVNCAAFVGGFMLAVNGIAQIQQLAYDAVLFDILTGVIKPDTTGPVMNSLFALKSAAKSRGQTWTAAKLDYADIEGRTDPAIVTFGQKHFVILSNAGADEVTINDGGTIRTMSVDEFRAQWDGTILGTFIVQPPAAKKLSDAQARTIVGAATGVITLDKAPLQTSGLRVDQLGQVLISTWDEAFAQLKDLDSRKFMARYEVPGGQTYDDVLADAIRMWQLKGVIVKPATPPALKPVPNEPAGYRPISSTLKPMDTLNQYATDQLYLMEIDAFGGNQAYLNACANYTPAGSALDGKTFWSIYQTLIASGVYTPPWGSEGYDAWLVRVRADGEDPLQAVNSGTNAAYNVNLKNLSSLAAGDDGFKRTASGQIVIQSWDDLKLAMSSKDRHDDIIYLPVDRANYRVEVVDGLIYWKQGAAVDRVIETYAPKEGLGQLTGIFEIKNREDIARILPSASRGSKVTYKPAKAEDYDSDVAKTVLLWQNNLRWWVPAKSTIIEDAGMMRRVETGTEFWGCRRNEAGAFIVRSFADLDRLLPNLDRNSDTVIYQAQGPQTWPKGQTLMMPAGDSRIKTAIERWKYYGMSWKEGSFPEEPAEGVKPPDSARRGPNGEYYVGSQAEMEILLPVLSPSKDKVVYKESANGRYDERLAYPIEKAIERWQKGLLYNIPTLRSHSVPYAPRGYIPIGQEDRPADQIDTTSVAGLNAYAEDQMKIMRQDPILGVKYYEEYLRTYWNKSYGTSNPESNALRGEWDWWQELGQRGFTGPWGGEGYNAWLARVRADGMSPTTAVRFPTYNVHIHLGDPVAQTPITRPAKMRMDAQGNIIVSTMDEMKAILPFAKPGVDNIKYVPEGMPINPPPAEEGETVPAEEGEPAAEGVEGEMPPAPEDVGDPTIREAIGRWQKGEIWRTTAPIPQAGLAQPSAEYESVIGLRSEDVPAGMNLYTMDQLRLMESDAFAGKQAAQELATIYWDQGQNAETRDITLWSLLAKKTAEGQYAPPWGTEGYDHWIARTEQFHISPLRALRKKEFNVNAPAATAAVDPMTVLKKIDTLPVDKTEAEVKAALQSVLGDDTLVVTAALAEGDGYFEIKVQLEGMEKEIVLYTDDQGRYLGYQKIIKVDEEEILAFVDRQGLSPVTDLVDAFDKINKNIDEDKLDYIDLIYRKRDGVQNALFDSFKGILLSILNFINTSPMSSARIDKKLDEKKGEIPAFVATLLEMQGVRAEEIKKDVEKIYEDVLVRAKQMTIPSGLLDMQVSGLERTQEILDGRLDKRMDSLKDDLKALGDGLFEGCRYVSENYKKEIEIARVNSMVSAEAVRQGNGGTMPAKIPAVGSSDLYPSSVFFNNFYYDQTTKKWIDLSADPRLDEQPTNIAALTPEKLKEVSAKLPSVGDLQNFIGEFGFTEKKHIDGMLNIKNPPDALALVADRINRAATTGYGAMSSTSTGTLYSTNIHTQYLPNGVSETKHEYTVSRTFKGKKEPATVVGFTYDPNSGDPNYHIKGGDTDTFSTELTVFKEVDGVTPGTMYRTDRNTATAGNWYGTGYAWTSSVQEDYRFTGTVKMGSGLDGRRVMFNKDKFEYKTDPDTGEAMKACFGVADWEDGGYELTFLMPIDIFGKVVPRDAKMYLDKNNQFVKLVYSPEKTKLGGVDYENRKSFWKGDAGAEEREEIVKKRDSTYKRKVVVDSKWLSARFDAEKYPFDYTEIVRDEDGKPTGFRGIFREDTKVEDKYVPAGSELTVDTEGYLIQLLLPSGTIITPVDETARESKDVEVTININGEVTGKIQKTVLSEDKKRLIEKGSVIDLNNISSARVKNGNVIELKPRNSGGPQQDALVSQVIENYGVKESQEEKMQDTAIKERLATVGAYYAAQWKDSAEIYTAAASLAMLVKSASLRDKMVLEEVLARDAQGKFATLLNRLAKYDFDVEQWKKTDPDLPPLDAPEMQDYATNGYYVFRPPYEQIYNASGQLCYRCTRDYYDPDMKVKILKDTTFVIQGNQCVVLDGSIITASEDEGEFAVKKYVQGNMVEVFTTNDQGQWDEQTTTAQDTGIITIVKTALLLPYNTPMRRTITKQGPSEFAPVIPRKDLLETVAFRVEFDYTTNTLRVMESRGKVLQKAYSGAGDEPAMLAWSKDVVMQEVPTVDFGSVQYKDDQDRIVRISQAQTNHGNLYIKTAVLDVNGKETSSTVDIYVFVSPPVVMFVNGALKKVPSDYFQRTIKGFVQSSAVSLLGKNVERVNNYKTYLRTQFLQEKDWTRMARELEKYTNSGVLSKYNLLIEKWLAANNLTAEFKKGLWDQRFIVDPLHPKTRMAYIIWDFAKRYPRALEETGLDKLVNQIIDMDPERIRLRWMRYARSLENYFATETSTADKSKIDQWIKANGMEDEFKTGPWDQKYDTAPDYPRDRYAYLSWLWAKEGVDALAEMGVSDAMPKPALIQTGFICSYTQKINGVTFNITVDGEKVSVNRPDGVKALRVAVDENNAVRIAGYTASGTPLVTDKTNTIERHSELMCDSSGRMIKETVKKGRLSQISLMPPAPGDTVSRPPQPKSEFVLASTTEKEYAYYKIKGVDTALPTREITYDTNRKKIQDMTAKYSSGGTLVERVTRQYKNGLEVTTITDNNLVENKKPVSMRQVVSRVYNTQNILVGRVTQLYRNEGTGLKLREAYTEKLVRGKLKTGLRKIYRSTGELEKSILTEDLILSDPQRAIYEHPALVKKRETEVLYDGLGAAAKTVREYFHNGIVVATSFFLSGSGLQESGKTYTGTIQVGDKKIQVEDVLIKGADGKYYAFGDMGGDYPMFYDADGTVLANVLYTRDANNVIQWDKLSFADLTPKIEILSDHGRRITTYKGNQIEISEEDLYGRKLVYTVTTKYRDRVVVEDLLNATRTTTSKLPDGKTQVAIKYLSANVDDKREEVIEKAADGVVTSDIYTRTFQGKTQVRDLLANTQQTTWSDGEWSYEQTFDTERSQLWRTKPGAEGQPEVRELVRSLVVNGDVVTADGTEFGGVKTGTVIRMPNSKMALYFELEAPGAEKSEGVKKVLEIGAYHDVLNQWTTKYEKVTKMDYDTNIAQEVTVAVPRIQYDAQTGGLSVGFDKDIPREIVVINSGGGSMAFILGGYTLTCNALEFKDGKVKHQKLVSEPFDWDPSKTIYRVNSAEETEGKISWTNPKPPPDSSMTKPPFPDRVADIERTFTQVGPDRISFQDKETGNKLLEGSYTRDSSGIANEGIGLTEAETVSVTSAYSARYGKSLTTMDIKVSGSTMQLSSQTLSDGTKRTTTTWQSGGAAVVTSVVDEKPAGTPLTRKTTMGNTTIEEDFATGTIKTIVADTQAKPTVTTEAGADGKPVKRTTLRQDVTPNQTIVEDFIANTRTTTEKSGKNTKTIVEAPPGTVAKMIREADFNTAGNEITVVDKTGGYVGQIITLGASDGSVKIYDITELLPRGGQGIEIKEMDATGKLVRHTYRAPSTYEPARAGLKEDYRFTDYLSKKTYDVRTSWDGTGYVTVTAGAIVVQTLSKTNGGVKTVLTKTLSGAYRGVILERTDEGSNVFTDKVTVQDGQGWYRDRVRTIRWRKNADGTATVLSDSNWKNTDGSPYPPAYALDDYIWHPAGWLAPNGQIVASIPESAKKLEILQDPNFYKADLPAELYETYDAGRVHALVEDDYATGITIMTEKLTDGGYRVTELSATTAGKKVTIQDKNRNPVKRVTIEGSTTTTEDIASGKKTVEIKFANSSEISVFDRDGTKISHQITVTDPATKKSFYKNEITGETVVTEDLGSNNKRETRYLADGSTKITESSYGQVYKERTIKTLSSGNTEEVVKQGIYETRIECAPDGREIGNSTREFDACGSWGSGGYGRNYEKTVQYITNGEPSLWSRTTEDEETGRSGVSVLRQKTNQSGYMWSGMYYDFVNNAPGPVGATVTTVEEGIKSTVDNPNNGQTIVSETLANGNRAVTTVSVAGAKTSKVYIEKDSAGNVVNDVLTVVEKSGKIVTDHKTGISELTWNIAMSDGSTAQFNARGRITTTGGMEWFVPTQPAPAVLQSDGRTVGAASMLNGAGSLTITGGQFSGYWMLTGVCLQTGMFNAQKWEPISGSSDPGVVHVLATPAGARLTDWLSCEPTAGGYRLGVTHEVPYGSVNVDVTITPQARVEEVSARNLHLEFTSNASGREQIQAATVNGQDLIAASQMLRQQMEDVDAHLYWQRNPATEMLANMTMRPQDVKTEGDLTNFLSQLAAAEATVKVSLLAQKENIDGLLNSIKNSTLSDLRTLSGYEDYALYKDLEVTLSLARRIEAQANYFNINNVNAYYYGDRSQISDALRTQAVMALYRETAASAPSIMSLIGDTAALSRDTVSSLPQVQIPAVDLSALDTAGSSSELAERTESAASALSNSLMAYNKDQEIAELLQTKVADIYSRSNNAMATLMAPLQTLLTTAGVTGTARARVEEQVRGEITKAYVQGMADFGKDVAEIEKTLEARKGEIKQIKAKLQDVYKHAMKRLADLAPAQWNSAKGQVDQTVGTMDSSLGALSGQADALMSDLSEWSTEPDWRATKGQEIQSRLSAIKNLYQQARTQTAGLVANVVGSDAVQSNMLAEIAANVKACMDKMMFDASESMPSTTVKPFAGEETILKSVLETLTSSLEDTNIEMDRLLAKERDIAGVLNAIDKMMAAGVSQPAAQTAGTAALSVLLQSVTTRGPPDLTDSQRRWVMDSGLLVAIASKIAAEGGTASEQTKKMTTLINGALDRLSVKFSKSEDIVKQLAWFQQQGLVVEGAKALASVLRLTSSIKDGFASAAVDATGILNISYNDTGVPCSTMIEPQQDGNFKVTLTRVNPSRYVFDSDRVELVPAKTVREIKILNYMGSVVSTSTEVIETE